MTRRTQDGSFLTALVRHNLLEVATEGATPFESTYRLSERGKHAAEYGVYDIEWAEYKALSQGKKEQQPAGTAKRGRRPKKATRAEQES